MTGSGCRSEPSTRAGGCGDLAVSGAERHAEDGGVLFIGAGIDSSCRDCDDDDASAHG